MPDGIGKALLGLLMQPLFITSAVIAVISGITLVKNWKTFSRGMKAALIAVCGLTSIFVLLLLVAVFISAGK